MARRLEVTVDGESVVGVHHEATDDRVRAVATRAPVTYNRAFDDYRDTVRRDGVLPVEDGRAIDAGFFADLEAYDFEAVAGEGHRFSERAEDRLRERVFAWLSR